MTKMLFEIYEEANVLKRLESENKETLERLSGLLREQNTKNVTFVGRGTSDHASIYGQYLMSIVGNVNAGLAVPSCISVYGSHICYGGSLVIAVSQSGMAADALAVVEQAKSCGAITVAVTNCPGSPLAKAADFHLFCAAGEERSVAATKTFSAQLGLLFLLTAYWFKRNDMLESFSALPRKIVALLQTAEMNLDMLTVRYRYMEDGFVLSRGITYPLALETMLKVQETCYVKLKAYSSADFFHGPLAQLDINSPVLIYALSGNAETENLAMADKIRSIGIEPLVVTDSGEICSQSAFSYLIPNVENQFAAPILLATFAQLFAQSLCVLKGLDPDNPRNLRKVTITK